MGNVVPVDGFTGEWYPGYKPEHFNFPYWVDAPSPFQAGDENHFWFLDFHWSRGLTPLAATLWSADGYCWGTQHAVGEAAAPARPRHHVPASRAPTSTARRSPRPTRARSARGPTGSASTCRTSSRTTAPSGRRGATSWRPPGTYFQGIDFAALPTSDLAGLLHQARRYHKRAMEIHFDVMYPMLVNFLGFYGACAELGIDTNLVGKFLQGEDTKIMELDRELSGLAAKARRAGLAQVFADHEPGELRAALSAHGGSASPWLTDFDDFLAVYGHRQDATCDVGLPSWIEDNSNAFGNIKTFLLKDEDHDFAAAAQNALAERDEAIEIARSGLTREEQAVFDGGLAANQAANFPWWQDDHNFYIDLKVMLPLRRACQELARRVDADNKDDMLYLFWPELLDVAAGKPYPGELKSLVADRRQYFDHWHAKRSEMPKVLGTVPESVEDPVLIEIFGINPGSLRAVQNPDAANQTTLAGVAAAKGVVTGIARVLQSADELHRLAPGEILVCESTSPNWTPAFGKIAGAVCDGGGMLSHAAIVGREYGVPTVTAAGVATLAIGDGDKIEVDGTNGKVTILKRAAELANA